jgi:hypothetical protein
MAQLNRTGVIWAVVFVVCVGVVGVRLAHGQGSRAPRTAVYYAEETVDVHTSGISNWTDITGANLSFTTTGAEAVLDLLANGAVTAGDSNFPWVRCGFRFVIDGVAGGDPVYGDMLASPALNEGGGGEWLSFSLTRRVAVRPGHHTVSTEMVHVSTQTASDDNCVIDGGKFSGVRLYVTAR